MYSTMRRRSIRQLLPNSIELGYVALVACALILLGNGKLILERMGMIGSAHLIGEQVSTKVTAGLDSLSTFQFTGSAVTLMVWGATGLIIYSVLQSIVRTLRIIQYERTFDTSQYVHPQNFTHQAYWRQVTADTVLGFLLLVLLVIAGVLYVVVAVPASFAYVQRFILSPGLSTTLDPFFSLLIAFVATTLLYFVLKLVIRHHEISTVDT